MPASPKISVITVVKNDAARLEKTILSVLEQDYPDIEYIIVDGDSKDGTLDIIRKYQERISNWLSEPDKGIYDAMNKGVAMATGQYIHFLNAGDLYPAPETLTRVFTADIELSDLIIGETLVDYGSFVILKKNHELKNIWKGMMINHQAVFFTARTIQKIPFDLQWKTGADYNLLVKLINASVRIRYLPIPVVVYGAFGISGKYMVKTAIEHFKIAKKHSNLCPGRKLYHYLKIATLFLLTSLRAVLPSRIYYSCVRIINRKSLIKS